jgi:hypothetical protein
MQYPHLEPCLLMSMGEAGGAVIRRFSPEGSLRDILYGTKPCDSWISKIAHGEKAKPFSEQEIARFGAKILDTLIFLADKGLHHGKMIFGITNYLCLFYYYNVLNNLISFCYNLEHACRIHVKIFHYFITTIKKYSYFSSLCSVNT